MKFLKLNEDGVAHYLVGALVVALIAAVGVRVVNSSHAETPSSVTASNASSIQPLLYNTSNGSGGNYYIYAYGSNGKSTTIEGPSTNNAAYQYPSYSPNGKEAVWAQVTSSDSADQMQFYNAKSQTLAGNYVFPSGEQTGGLYEVKPAWFPGNDKIAYAFENQSGVFSIQTLTTSGSWNNLANLSSSYGTVDSVAVTNSGNYIVFGTNTGVYALKVSSPSKVTVLWDESDALLGGPLSAGETNCYATEAQPGTADKVGWICNYYDNNGNAIGWEVDNGPVKANAYNTIYSEQIPETGSGTSVYYSIQDLAWSPNGNKLALDTIRNSNIYNTNDCSGDTLQTQVVTLSSSKDSAPNSTLSPIASGKVNPSPCNGGGNEVWDNNDIAWSPNGANLAYIDNDHIYNIPPSAYEVSSSGSSAPVLVSSNSANLDW